tara:strand:+ start:2562 stop:3503 length:942 start_codon:yes stop_codon:yes gene_type:complete
MAFLDNSGDIILDAVLTDHGRMVLAKGDGSFQITKFALGDEEIDYSLYNPNHASGSAYYDLEILQVPVLEAFTNNASSMKSKLVTMSNNNILYMPVLKLNTNLTNTKQHSSGSHMIAVDRETEGTDAAQTSAAVGFIGSDSVQGIIFGQSLEGSNFIRVDQGLDTTEISPKQRSAIREMIETSYIIQIDNRLGRIVTVQNDRVSEDYIDDDNIAYYTVDASDGVVLSNTDDTNSTSQTISGPRGSILEFKIEASLEIQTSTFLFNRLGGTATMTNKGGTSQTVRFIDTVVRITGMTTGYSIDIPIRFIKTVTS